MQNNQMMMQNQQQMQGGNNFMQGFGNQQQRMGGFGGNQGNMSQGGGMMMQGNNRMPQQQQQFQQQQMQQQMQQPQRQQQMMMGGGGGPQQNQNQFQNDNMYHGGGSGGGSGGQGNTMNMLLQGLDDEKQQMGIGGRRLNDPNQSMMEFTRENDLMPQNPQNNMNFAQQQQQQQNSRDSRQFNNNNQQQQQQQQQFNQQRQQQQQQNMGNFAQDQQNNNNFQMQRSQSQQSMHNMDQLQMMGGGQGGGHNQQQMQQQHMMPPKPFNPKDQIAMFGFKPPQSQSYVFEFTKRSNRGCLVAKQILTLASAPETPQKSLQETMNMSMAFDDDEDGAAKQKQQQPAQPQMIQDEICYTLTTDDDRGYPNCKSMSSFPIQFDEYMKNQYYFQFRIEENYDEQVSTQPGQFWKTAAKLASMGSNGIKMSIGICKDNFDLNKNSIIENKKKDYWVLDLFDGEAFSGSMIKNGRNPFKYMQPQDYVRKGDVIGCLVNVEVGTIEYYKNGRSLGICFQEGVAFRKSKVKLYPFIQLFKGKVSVYQPNDMLAKQSRIHKPPVQQQQQDPNMNHYQQNAMQFNQNQMQQQQQFQGGNQNNFQNNQMQQQQMQGQNPQQQNQIMNQMQQQQQQQQPPQPKINLKEQMKIQDQLEKVEKEIQQHEQKLKDLKIQKETLQAQLQI